MIQKTTGVKIIGVEALPVEAPSAFSHHLVSDWLTPYEPPSLLKNGHAQTLAGNYWPRPPLTIPFESEAVEVDPADGTRVLCHCHWQPDTVRMDRLTVLLVHGLEGSSDSQYIQGITVRAWDAGCNVIRMNMRNCGGTDTWTSTLYHSGLSADVGAVADHFARLHGLRRLALAGYSMGGNLVLKLAGELTARPLPCVVAAVGVCPAMDLAASADALHEPANRMYERHFLRNLMRRFRRKAELFPEIYSLKDVGPVRTIREFDDQITARYSGFSGADDYYFKAASSRVASSIAISTLVIHALDDPFIRMMPKTREDLAENPAVRLLETKHGGHCAFLAKRTLSTVSTHLASRHWAEATLVSFLMATAGHGDGS